MQVSAILSLAPNGLNGSPTAAKLMVADRDASLDTRKDKAPSDYQDQFVAIKMGSSKAYGVWSQAVLIIRSGRLPIYKQ